MEPIQTENQKIIQLLEENHRMLKALYRKFFWQKVWSWFKFVILAIGVVWTYWQIRPVIKQVNSIYTGTQNAQNYTGNKWEELKNSVKNLGK